MHWEILVSFPLQWNSEDQIGPFPFSKVLPVNALMAPANPSCRQTTVASKMSQPLASVVPQIPAYLTSTRPWYLVDVPFRRTSISVKRKRNLIHLREGKCIMCKLVSVSAHCFISPYWHMFSPFSKGPAVLHTTAASLLCRHWLLPHPLWVHVVTEDSFPEQLRSLNHTRPVPPP